MHFKEYNIFFLGSGNINKGKKAKEKYNLKSCKHFSLVYMFNSDKKQFSKETTPIRSFNLGKLESHMSSRCNKDFYISVQTCYIKACIPERNPVGGEYSNVKSPRLTTSN